MGFSPLGPRESSVASASSSVVARFVEVLQMSLSPSIASQPWPCQIPRSHLHSRKLQMKLGVRTTALTVRSERCTFGSRFCGLEEGRVGFVVRSQKEDKEELEPRAFSFQRANAVTGIFMATLVWICLFLWVSVTNSEAGGGTPGRRK